MDNMFIHHALHILQASPQAISAYMSLRGDQDRCLELWHILLVAHAQHVGTLSSLLDVIQVDTCPKYLQPKVDELDDVIECLFLEALSGSVEISRVDLVKRVIQAQSELTLAPAIFNSLFKYRLFPLREWTRNIVPDALIVFYVYRGRHSI